MSIPRTLFLLSAAGVLYALLVPTSRDVLLIAAPCLLASLLIWIRALVAGSGKTNPSKDASAEDETDVPNTPDAGADLDPATDDQNWIILDGSNVMHWNDTAPDIGIVRTLVRALERHGYSVGVVFDANAGYLISDSYMHDEDLGALLDLPPDRVMVVPKGTQADGFILRAARDFNARIVTNDRFRDWQEQYPETARPGFLIQGGFRDGAPYLGS